MPPPSSSSSTAATVECTSFFVLLRALGVGATSSSSSSSSLSPLLIVFDDFTLRTDFLGGVISRERAMDCSAYGVESTSSPAELHAANQSSETVGTPLEIAVITCVDTSGERLLSSSIEKNGKY
jgi:hypothetical protein